ncbi:MAG: SAM-dependent methyltransferase, partial [Planctomycetes bacterium]|nr:SAM-dependent methyltransferase [Planctomycetota bacterium]
AVAVVLLAFLVSSGLGSLCQRTLFDRGLLTVPRLALLLAAVLLAGNWLLPELFHSGAIAWPIGAKIGVTIAAIFVFAFPMGMFFPAGIRLVENAAPDFVPWAWGSNSAASVIGSILALILAIHTGFAAVAVIAAAIYLLTTVPSVAALRRYGAGT